jgi:outer membrane protein assembly factor BamE (lipoprotein component of BamABCDE complex)
LKEKGLGFVDSGRLWYGAAVVEGACRMKTRSGDGTAAGCGLLLAALLCLPACRDSRNDPRQAQQIEVSAAEWNWLQTAHQELAEKRARLTRAEATAANPPAEELARLRREVDALSIELNRRLVEYINANAVAQDETPGDRLIAAIRMKSDEDIRLARDYIEKAGDYRRAIEIYETALAADPANPRLREGLENARERRYVTLERFAHLKEGMTQAEVRRLLGPPNLQDVRAYPERGVTAWFYPKDASGAAAAVWFREDGPAPEVYQLDFDAIRPPQPGAAPGSQRRRPAPPQEPAASPPPPAGTPPPSRLPR